MRKVVTAEYDAAQNVLRLLEPLDGVRDHQMVQVQVIATEAKAPSGWIELEGSLSKEAGDDLARAVNEMFPPWND
jgi:hypothetical protein